MLKMTGHEFKALMADKAFWPDGAYYDDCAVKLNGLPVDELDVNEIGPTDIVSIEGGQYFEAPGSEWVYFEPKAALWFAQRNVTTLTIEVEDHLFDEVMQQLSAMRGVTFVK